MTLLLASRVAQLLLYTAQPPRIPLALPLVLMPPVTLMFPDIVTTAPLLWVIEPFSFSVPELLLTVWLPLASTIGMRTVSVLADESLMLPPAIWPLPASVGDDSVMELPFN